MLGTIILIIIFLLIGFFIRHVFFEPGEWKDKKRQLKDKHEKELMELKHKHEKEALEKDKLMADRDKDFGIMYVKDIKELKDLVMSHEKYLRQDAVKRSRVSILGKVYEQIAPSLKNFPFKPEDARFMGAPIDYIVFEGMGEKNIKRVYFVEIKSGKSRLNKQEKTLKDTIQRKKVYWKEVRVGDEDQVKKGKVKQEEYEDVIGKHDLYAEFRDRIENMKTQLKGKHNLTKKEWEKVNKRPKQYIG